MISMHAELKLRSWKNIWIWILRIEKQNNRVGPGVFLILAKQKMVRCKRRSSPPLEVGSTALPHPYL